MYSIFVKTILYSVRYNLFTYFNQTWVFNILTLKYYNVSCLIFGYSQIVVNGILFQILEDFLKFEFIRIG